MRRIVKPFPAMVEAAMQNNELLCYQYVNWWLYQKGSDEIIWSLDDNTELLKWCSANKTAIITELANMVGAKTMDDKYGWLLGDSQE